MNEGDPIAGWGWTRRNIITLIVLTIALAGLAGLRWRANTVNVSPDLTVTPAAVTPAAERVDPNTASWASLARLPRIGPAGAKAICAYRDAIGTTDPTAKAFTCPQDLAKVKGIGPAAVEAVTPYVTFEPWPTPESSSPQTPR